MSLSTGTLNLKFMQRGNQPNAGPSNPSAPKSSNRKVDPAHWVLPSATAASVKGKGKAVNQDIEFEGSYLPFLEDEQEVSTGGGRRSFGLAPKPAPVAIAPVPTPGEAIKPTATEPKDEEPSPSEDTDAKWASPPKTFIKPVGFEDVKPKVKNGKGKRKSDAAEIGAGSDEIVQGARAKKKPKKKVVKNES